MSDPIVTKTDTGWIVQKTVGSNTAVVKFTDDNKNGKMDKGDKYTIVSGNASIFTKEDFAECAKSTITQEGSSGNAEDLFNTSKSQRDIQREQQYQKTQQPAKKKGFWGTFGQIAGVVGRGAMGFMGMLLGFGGGGNAWAFNGNSNNDWGVRGYSGYTGGMLAGSSALGMGMGSGMGMGGMNVGGGDYTAGLTEIMQMQNDENAKRNEEHQQWLEEYKADQETKQAEAQKKATVAKAEKIHELSQKEGATICDNNKAAITEIYNIDAEEYDEEQTAIINKIAAYPEVPHNIVANSKDETDKLGANAANKLDALIKKYDKAPNPLKKSEVMDEAKYKKLKELFEKAKTQELTAEEIKSIKDIIEKPIDKTEEEKE